MKTPGATSSVSASTRITSSTDSPWPPSRTEADAEYGEVEHEYPLPLPPPEHPPNQFRKLPQQADKVGGWAAELRILGAPAPQPSLAGVQIDKPMQNSGARTEAEVRIRIEALRESILAAQKEKCVAIAEAEAIRQEADILEQKKDERTQRLAAQGISWDVEARLKHAELGNARLAVAYRVQVQRLQDELEAAAAEREELDARLSACQQRVRETRQQTMNALALHKELRMCEESPQPVSPNGEHMSSGQDSAKSSDAFWRQQSPTPAPSRKDHPERDGYRSAPTVWPPPLPEGAMHHRRGNLRAAVSPAPRPPPSPQLRVECSGGSYTTPGPVLPSHQECSGGSTRGSPAMSSIDVSEGPPRVMVSSVSPMRSSLMQPRLDSPFCRARGTGLPQAHGSPQPRARSTWPPKRPESPHCNVYRRTSRDQVEASMSLSRSVLSLSPSRLDVATPVAPSQSSTGCSVHSRGVYSPPPSPGQSSRDAQHSTIAKFIAHRSPETRHIRPLGDTYMQVACHEQPYLRLPSAIAHQPTPTRCDSTSILKLATSLNSADPHTPAPPALAAKHVAPTPLRTSTHSPMRPAVATAAYSVGQAPTFLNAESGVTAAAAAAPTAVVNLGGSLERICA